MSKPTSKPNKLCSPQQLPAKLVELLRDGPATSDHLARLTGYSGNAVRENLFNLQSHGYVSRNKGQAGSHGGWRYVWSANSDAQPPATRLIEREPTGFSSPRQVITKDYPPMHRRDALVSALFGPAHREAA